MAMGIGPRDPVERQKIYFQFITTPTADTTGTSLLLHFDNQRYLFGHIAEGTQRACIQRGVGLKKLRNFFLSGEVKWANHGGLIGLLLTLADVQAEELVEGKRQPLHIFGGPKLWHTMACARRFVFRTGMPLRVYEKSTEHQNSTIEPDFSDDNIDVWSIPAITGPGQSFLNTEEKSKRSSSPNTVDREQKLRQKTVHDMFDSDWKLDRLTETLFKDVVFPAMVWVRNPESKELHATFCTKTEDAPHIDHEQVVFVRTPWPAALVTDLPPADNLPEAVSMSYVVKGRPQRGKFNAKKAQELGVPRGPLNGILASGQSITLDDGRVVKSEDVMGELDPGRGMIILDIPHSSYIEDVMNHLSRLQQQNVLKGIEAMCWILGPDVVQSKEFNAARIHFADLKHVISSVETSANTLAMDSSAAASVRLSQIRPNSYLVPLHENRAKSTLEDLGIENGLAAERSLIVNVAPALAIDKSEIPETLDVKCIEKWCKSDLGNLIPPSNNTNVHGTTNDADVELTTLGTGSAAPSKYRNVSSNLLKIPGFGYALFDVGEGTLGQLRRIYTPDELDEVLCNLRLIWVSHLHADHHLGTISILDAYQQAVAKRVRMGKTACPQLHLVSEKNMVDFLLDYESVEKFDCVFLRVANSKLTDGSWKPVDVRETSLPIKELQTCMVKHCHGAQAVSVTFKNGFKISYSGDCRPSQKFAEIGADSDILIHEATFDDGLEGDAKAKRHCTTAEALGVALAMKAKNVVLTHFSQRYQKLPVLTNIVFPGQIDFEEGDENAGNEEPVDDNMAPRPFSSDSIGAVVVEDSKTGGDVSLLQKVAAEMNVCVAFDMMKVNISQIKDMHKYYPAIERMFEIEQGKTDARRAVKRDLNDEMSRKKNNQPKSRSASNNRTNKYEFINRSNGPSGKKVSADDASTSGVAKDDFSGMRPNDATGAVRLSDTINADMAQQAEGFDQPPTRYHDKYKDSAEVKRESKASLKRLERSQLRSSPEVQMNSPNGTNRSQKKVKLSPDDT